MAASEETVEKLNALKKLLGNKPLAFALGRSSTSEVNSELWQTEEFVPSERDVQVLDKLWEAYELFQEREGGDNAFRALMWGCNCWDDEEQEYSAPLYVLRKGQPADRVVTSIRNYLNDVWL